MLGKGRPADGVARASAKTVWVAGELRTNEIAAYAPKRAAPAQAVCVQTLWTGIYVIGSEK